MVSHFGRMAGARACTTTVRKEDFDNSVLERVKRHHHQPRAGPENPLGRLQSGNQLAKLIVYKNAQGLECTGRRMDIAGAVAEDGPHDMCKVMRGADWLIGARIHDGTRDLARMPLLAKRIDDTGEIPLACTVDHVGRARTFGAHAHVERTVESE